jgi:hypothetical protein
MNFSLPAMLDELASKDLVLGLFLIGAGLVFMIMGVRMSRSLIALSFGVIGFVLAGCLSKVESTQIICGLAGSVLLAGLSMLRVKASVAVLTGSWVALTAFALGSHFKFTDQNALLFAVAVGSAAASLTFILYKETIAFVTSLEGAMLFVGGLIVFFSHNSIVWGHIRLMVVQNAFFLPFLVFAGTVTGFYLQLTELRQKETGMAPS